MPIRINRFVLAYKIPDHGGIVDLELVNGEREVLRGLNSDQFNAINTMLDNDPVFYDRATGWFTTTAEYPTDN